MPLPIDLFVFPLIIVLTDGDDDDCGISDDEIQAMHEEAAIVYDNPNAPAVSSERASKMLRACIDALDGSEQDRNWLRRVRDCEGTTTPTEAACRYLAGMWAARLTN